MVWGVDGGNRLHLCFDHNFDSKLHIVFDKKKKKKIISFLFRIMLFNDTYIQVLIKDCMKLELNSLCKSRSSVLSFDVLHLQIFIQQSILGAMKLVRMIKNAGIDR